MIGAEYSTRTLVKICGLKTPDAMTAALEGGADFVGLVFHEPSPRHIEIEIAAYLASYVPESVTTVALLVDPDDKKLADILSAVRIDMIQLHGTETPGRVAEIGRRTGKPVIKALGIGDLSKSRAYEEYADWLLIDSPGGGTGQAFDWSKLEGFAPSKPWMLAGGLNAGNVAGAINSLHPTAVDVSSGVESAHGVKDPAKIRTFLATARST